MTPKEKGRARQSRPERKTDDDQTIAARARFVNPPWPNARAVFWDFICQDARALVGLVRRRR